MFFIGPTPQPSQKDRELAAKISHEFLSLPGCMFHHNASEQSLGMLIQYLPWPNLLSPGSLVYGGNSSARGAASELLEAPLKWTRVDQKEGLKGLQDFDQKLKKRADELSNAVRGMIEFEGAYGALMDEWFQYLRSGIDEITTQLDTLQALIKDTSRQVGEAVKRRERDKKLHGAWSHKGEHLFCYFAEGLVQRLIADADPREVKRIVGQFVLEHHSDFNLTPIGTPEGTIGGKLEFSRERLYTERRNFMRSTLPKWKKRPFWETLKTIAEQLEKATGWTGLLP